MLTEQQGRILDEHGIGEVVERREPAHLQPRLRQRPLIGRMLRDGFAPHPRGRPAWSRTRRGAG